jgi:hypothetical protein
MHQLDGLLEKFRAAMVQHMENTLFMVGYMLPIERTNLNISLNLGRTMVSIGSIGVGNREKGILQAFMIVSKIGGKPDQAAIDIFKSLSLEGGSFLLTPSWLKRLNVWQDVSEIDTPITLWMHFVFYNPNPYSFMGWMRLNNPFAVSIAAIQKIKEHEDGPLKKRHPKSSNKLKNQASDISKKPDGDWSSAMSKTEMILKLGMKRTAFETFAKHHGLKRISRQLWQIRIDKMDTNTRKKLERHI